MSRRTFTIYALVDPCTSAIRYIGQTMTPKERKRVHQTGGGHARCGCWERSLLRQGFVPIFRVLERVSTKEQADIREKYWIAYGRDVGWSLTNLANGGQGGWEHAEESKRKISEAAKKRKGWKHTKEARRKIGKASKGYKRTADWYAKVSKALTGKLHPHKGVPRSQECRDKIGAIQKRAWGRKKYREHMSGVHKKEYPALYNIETGKVIPPGRGLMEMSKKYGLYYHTVSLLIRGKRTTPYRGWVLLDKKNEYIGG